jgi:crotonobetainyl-CoA:carnitine CoA-transferase CaiB-like acyl-CoA transferase
MANTGALKDLRVIDLTDDSGRFATKLLAEAGADVIRLGRAAAGAST